MENDLIRKDILEKSLEALNKLSPKHYDVLTRRILEEETLSEIGLSYGLSRERIRQIEAKAERWIKEYAWFKLRLGHPTGDRPRHSAVIHPD